MKTKKNRTKELDTLIEEGNKYSFDNNSQQDSPGYYYSSASTEFLAWLSKVETISLIIMMITADQAT